MTKNTTQVVVSTTLVLLQKKKKLLKSWRIKIKTFFKTKKMQAAEKLEDLVTSDRAQELFLTPLKSRVFRESIEPNIIKLILGLFNAKIMNKIENYALKPTNSESFASVFNTSSKFSQFFFILGICTKIFTICNSCTTIRETPLFSSTILIRHDSKNKIMKRVKVEYFLKGKLLNLFNLVSLEIKISDLLHYLLALSETRRLMQRVVNPKFLRQIDFAILLVIIVIEILFTILDSINLNSSKK